MKARFLVLTFILAAGCAAWRTGSAVSAAERPAPLFYSDLGPDTIDVSGYPPEQRRNYAAYDRACSRCHTLARSINAPYANRGWWEFYTAKMSVRSKFQGDPLTKKELQAALDFLEFDSNERKVARAAEFDTLKSDLKARFEKALDERVESLQKQPQPRLNP